MTDYGKAALKVGIVSVISLVILIVGVYWAKEYRLSTTPYILEVHFSNVAGLSKGDPVTISGVKWGKVKDIRLGPEDAIVTLVLDRPVRLYTDYSIALKSVGLVGSRMVVINRGTKPPEIDPRLEKLRGMNLVDVSDIVGIMYDAILDLKAITEVLRVKEFQDILRESLKNMNRLSVTLSELMEENRVEMAETIRDFRRSSSLLRELVEQNRGKINVAVENFQRSSEDLSESVRKLNDLSESIRKLTESLNEGKGTLGKLINDPELYEDLRKTSRDLDSLVVDIKANPKRYINVEIF